VSLPASCLCCGACEFVHVSLPLAATCRQSGAMERGWRYSVPGTALLLLSSVLLLARAQYEKYSFRSFPESELMPLDSAYRYSLEQYAAGNWRESIRYLELSLRVHRLLRDSQLHCNTNCSLAPPLDQTPVPREFRELRVFSHILHRAICIRRCKLSLPAFNLSSPQRDTLLQFESRTPYKYLEHAYFQVRIYSTESADC